MKIEYLIIAIIGGFFVALLSFIFIFSRARLPINIPSPLVKNSQTASSSDKEIIANLTSKVKWLEENNQKMTTEQKEILARFQDLQEYTSTISAQPKILTSKSILAVSHTKGSTFTTSSTEYTPMGMYVNINCPKNCYLWINFYSSSKNLGTPNSAQGYYNTYDVFLDNADQSIFSQASYPAASSAIPVSLNAVLVAGAGVHTIDIRAKTTGGTLQSESSALQVMGIER